MDIKHDKGKITVLMFPWLAHGHISPFLELAKRLRERNFFIYFCSTPVNLASIKNNITQKHSPSLEFVELHVPSLPDLPSHLHTTNCLPPHLLPILKQAFDLAANNFTDILKTLKPDLLIYDFLQPWAPSGASSNGIPAVAFLSAGAAATWSFVVHGFKKGGAKFPFPEIFLDEYAKMKLNQLLSESSSNGIKNEDRSTECTDRSSNIILIRSFREIEGKYIDYFSSLCEKMMVPVGPLVRDSIDEHEEEEGEIITWLKKKEPSSTVFVSFGSEYFLSVEEIQEIANGLELSKANFIWVIRFPLGEKIRIEEALPQGFLERVGEKGIVVDTWAPQMKILGHPNTGGFVSHCGWSSLMEGMKFGIPIIAIPMHIDQPLNARFAEEIGVAMEVKRGKNGMLEKEVVAKVIKEVVVEEGGEYIRIKAREMSEIMRKKGDEEIDLVVKELLQLCEKMK